MVRSKQQKINLPSPKIKVSLLRFTKKEIKNPISKTTKFDMVKADSSFKKNYFICFNECPFKKDEKFILKVLLVLKTHFFLTFWSLEKTT